jgi:hypothetical protein
MRDLHRLDPAGTGWTNLTGRAAGTPPAARFGHGMAGAGAAVYVFGGCGPDGGGDRAIFVARLSYRERKQLGRGQRRHGLTHEFGDTVRHRSSGRNAGGTRSTRATQRPGERAGSTITPAEGGLSRAHELRIAGIQPPDRTGGMQ